MGNGQPWPGGGVILETPTPSSLLDFSTSHLATSSPSPSPTNTTNYRHLTTPFPYPFSTKIVV